MGQLSLQQPLEATHLVGDDLNDVVAGDDADERSLPVYHRNSSDTLNLHQANNLDQLGVLLSCHYLSSHDVAYDHSVQIDVFGEDLEHNISVGNNTFRSGWSHIAIDYNDIAHMMAPHQVAGRSNRVLGFRDDHLATAISSCRHAFDPLSLLFERTGAI